MTRLPIPRVGLVAALGLALFFAACGGHPAPHGYACDIPNSYCVTYAKFSLTDFSAAGLAGAYVNISNAHLTCTGACANPSHAGYIANLLMLIGDGNHWVEAGVWNDGFYSGGVTQWFEGAATNGIPHYRPVLYLGDLAQPTHTMGIEIRASGGPSAITGYNFRFTSFFYQNGTMYTDPYSTPALTLNPTTDPATPDSTTLLTNVEFGEFLHGTDGATAETSGFTPVQAINTYTSGASDLTGALPSGFPNSVYTTTLTRGEPLILVNHTADQPPYGVWFARGSIPASPAHAPALFECCTPGFIS